MSWLYVGCATTPIDARARGACLLPLPRELQAGSYELRLFRDNGYARLATASVQIR